MGKVSFLTKVLSYLKSDDKSVVVRVITKAQKVCKSAVRDGEQVLSQAKYEAGNKIDNLKEKLVDAKQALKDSYLSIDIKQCASADGVEEFIKNTYLPTIAKKLNNIKAIEKEIEAVEKSQEELAKKVAEDLALYNEVLTVLELDEEDVVDAANSKK